MAGILRHTGCRVSSCIGLSTSLATFESIQLYHCSQTNQNHFGERWCIKGINREAEKCNAQHPVLHFPLLKIGWQFIKRSKVHRGLVRWQDDTSPLAFHCFTTRHDRFCLLREWFIDARNTMPCINQCTTPLPHYKSWWEYWNCKPTFVIKLYNVTTEVITGLKEAYR